MAQQEPPKIEFPAANYPIKIMGANGEAYRDAVLSIVEKHAPGFARESVRINLSSKGTWQSLTVLITATGENQLRNLHKDLQALDDTKMVL